MPSRRARRARRRRGRVLALVAVAVLVTAAAVAVGVRLRPTGSQGSPSAAPTPTSSPTPVRDVDLSALPIPRAPFCDVLADDELATALGGEVTRTSHYGSGDRVQMAPGVTDVSHEYSCSYEAASGAVARAWVFAPPVSTREARGLVRDAARARGCRAVSGGPTFGRPSSTTVCDGRDGTEVTLRGLFGQSWLSCRLTIPGSQDTAADVRRTERWCVHAAETLGARP